MSGQPDGGAAPPDGPESPLKKTGPRTKRGEERVSEIMDIMVSGKWVTHKTPAELAAKWGIKKQSVHNYASEASRRIGAAVVGSEQLCARIDAMLEHIIATCLRKKRYTEAIKAIHVLTQGIDLRERRNLLKLKADKTDGAAGTLASLLAKALNEAPPPVDGDDAPPLPDDAGAEPPG
jgi:hypothetical protein